MVDKNNGQVDGVRVVRRKTPEMARIVEQGYGMSMEDAKRILDDWEKDPTRWSHADVQKARAALAAYETEPIPVDPEPGWTRKKRQYKR